jgi:F0F1-type ATP synthase membrane subunit a
MSSNGSEVTMSCANWLSYLKLPTDSTLLLGLALIVLFAFMLYRIVMQGMKSGKEMRVGQWFWWRK